LPPVRRELDPSSSTSCNQRFSRPRHWAPVPAAGYHSGRPRVHLENVG
jgi:hypothetical protein